MQSKRQLPIVTRILVIIASCLAAGMLFVPLWQISLVAPQYPEGLAMQIWLGQITGDLRTINILNHYIGMKHIMPDGIPELKIFPYLFGGIAVMGIVVAIVNRKILLHLATLVVLSTALIGLWDFWNWEYRYGHDLDESAPLKIQDSYDLPLIGTKQVTTVTTTSLPTTGGYLFFGVIALYFVSSGLAERKK